MGVSGGGTALVALLLLGGSAWAQDGATTAGEPPAEKPKLLIGPQLGLYIPTSARARDRFGDNWFNFGVGLGPVKSPSPDGEVLYDFQFISSRRNIDGTGNVSFAENILMMPLGATYRRGLGDPETSGPHPYVGASAGFLVTLMESEIDGVKQGVRTGYHGSVYGGVTLGQRAYVEARYFAMSKIRSFDLSGLSLSVGLRF